MKAFASKFSFVVLFVVMVNQISFGQDIVEKIEKALDNDDSIALASVIDKSNIDQCYNEYTPLALAIRQRASKCIDLLLTKGADVNVSCNYKSPVFFAVKYGNLELVKKIVAMGAKINEQSNKGMTLVEYARSKGKEDIVAYLESKK